jgi:DNA-binding CsgD family transcriptional regulator
MSETVQDVAMIELKNAAPAAAKSGDFLWAALANDSGGAVLVFDAQGKISFGNQTASAILTGAAATEFGSKSLHDVMKAEIAEEHLAHAKKVLETGQPVVIDGMIAGRLMRATLRPVRGESTQEHRVLETLRTIPAEEPTPETGNYVKAKTNDEGVLGKLTAREREVLFHIGRGLSTAKIAETLGRSTKTVEWHRVSLGNKLGITNRVELARIALKAGVTGLDD